MILVLSLLIMIIHTSYYEFNSFLQGNAQTGTLYSLPVWYCCRRSLIGSTPIIHFYQEIALLSLDLERPFLTVGLNWLHALWNLTSFCPLSYSQSHFCLPCWWCQQQAQALISLECCALLCVLWEVQDMGTLSLFVVPSMYLHKLSTKHCRAAVELKLPPLAKRCAVGTECIAVGMFADSSD